MKKRRKFDGRTKKALIKRLAPYWIKRSKLESFFNKAEKDIEEEMNKDKALKKYLREKFGKAVKLEFFYLDGDCIGVGATHYGNRKKIPLIHDSELYDEK